MATLAIAQSTVAAVVECKFFKGVLEGLALLGIH